jgi:hypothetical protein
MIHLRLKVSIIYFAQGKRPGCWVGHTEAICPGTLAGYNAIKLVKKESLLELPDDLAVGDAIRFVRMEMMNEGKLGLK